MTSDCYPLFDIVLCSDLALDSISALPGAPSYQLVFHTIEEINANEQLIHEWHTRSGELTLSAHLIEQPHHYRYRLFFPDGAHFYITADLAEIACAPLVDTTTDTIEHLLLDQVLPRVMAHRGNLVLHGSCVQLPDGKVIGFLGETGSGKSTLAAAFHQAGARLLTDDCFMLKIADEPSVLPGYPGLRLWPDIADALYNSARQQQMAHYSDKKRIQLQTETSHDDLKLAALYLIDLPDDTDAVVEAGVYDLASAAERSIALISASYSLNIQDQQFLETSLSQVNQIVATGLPIRRLTFPREFEQLPHLIETIERSL